MPAGVIHVSFNMPLLLGERRHEKIGTATTYVIALNQHAKAMVMEVVAVMTKLFHLGRYRLFELLFLKFFLFSAFSPLCKKTFQLA